MSSIVARFVQSAIEVKRYLMDFSLDLAVGENILTAVVNQIISPSGEVNPTLVVTNIALAPAVNGQVTQFTFFVSNGTPGQTYEVDFLVSTDLTQSFETVVAYNIVVKT